MAELLTIPLIVGPLLVIVGFFMHKSPPKEINSLIGYRTKTSMRNKETWDFAQVYSAREAMKAGGLLLLSSTVGFIPMSEVHKSIVGLVLMLSFMAIMIYRTEKAIKEKFE